MITEALWRNSNVLVDDKNPGDFNQALMELGATVCTPKNPNCSQCPISENCLAFQEVKQYKNGAMNKILNVKTEQTTQDIEDFDSSKH